MELESLSKKFELEDGILEEVQKQASQGNGSCQQASLFDFTENDGYYPYCEMETVATAGADNISQRMCIKYDLEKRPPLAFLEQDEHDSFHNDVSFSLCFSSTCKYCLSEVLHTILLCRIMQILAGKSYSIPIGHQYVHMSR